MKIKWREYEAYLVIILTFSVIAADCLKAFTLSEPELHTLESVFKANGFSFNYFSNVLAPQLCLYLVLLGLYAWLSFSVVRNLRKALLEGKGGAMIPIYLVLISSLAALLVNAVSYFAHPHLFNYGGWRLLALLGYNDEPLTNLYFGFDRAAIIVFAYTVYGFFREWITWQIERNNTSRLYQTHIVNQVTITVVIYFSIIAIFCAFGASISSSISIVYFSIIPSSLLVFFINVYWLFPSDKKQRRAATILKSLAIVILSSFPNLVFKQSIYSGNNLASVLIYSWLVQAVIVTPVSWLYFKQRKEKLAALKGIEEKLIRTNTDLQSLRAQINPHFLFNALNTLYGTALKEDAPKTVEGIQKLGDMMRFMLHENNQDFIALEKEIQYLSNYIDLQKLRITDQVQVDVNLDEIRCAQKQISPMLLIPFVENAFKHGISSSHPSWVKISLRCNDRSLQFSVRNSVILSKGNDPEKNSNGIGLENVRQRLTLLYPDRHSLSTSLIENEYIATLSIELR